MVNSEGNERLSREDRKIERLETSDDYIREYIKIDKKVQAALTIGETPSAEDEKHLKVIKRKWKGKFPTKSFQNAMIDYKEHVMDAPQPGEAPEGGPLAVPVDQETVKAKAELSLSELQKNVDRYFKDIDGIYYAAQELHENGFTPLDLQGGANQIAAVEAMFKAKPAVANTLKKMLATKKGPQFKEANDKLKSISKTLHKTYEELSDVHENVEEFEEGMMSGFLSDTMGNLKNSVAENPVKTLGVLAATLGLSYWAFTKMSDGFKSTMKPILGVGLAGLAANELMGMVSPSGRTILDRIMFNPNTFEYNSVMIRFKDEIQKMNPDNKHAFEAMMHLGDAKASTVASAFETAFRAHKEEINPHDIFAAGDITPEQSNLINAAGMYSGLRSMMLTLAHEKLGLKGEDDTVIQAGLEYFKDNFAGRKGDMKMFAVLSRLAATKGPEMSDSDGFRSPDDPNYTELPEQTPSDLELENKIEAVIDGISFSKPGDKPYVEVIGGIAYINGYPLEVTEKDGKFTFKDKVEGGEMKLNANISSKIKSAAEARFGEVIEENKKLKFKNEGNQRGWYIEPVETIQDFAGMGVSSDVEIYAEYSPDSKEVRLRRPGDMNRYKTIEEALKAGEKSIVMERLYKDLDHILGDANFDLVESGYDKAANSAVFKIKSRGTSLSIGSLAWDWGDAREATIMYNNGKVESINGLIAGATEKYMTRFNTLLGDLDSMEWSLGTSQYEAYVGIYKQQMQSKLKEKLLTLPTGSNNPEREIEALFAEFEKDITDFATLKGGATVGSTEQLREVEKVMNSHMIDKEEWEKPAFQVLEFLSGRYEFKNYYLLDKPAIFESYLKIYYEKIKYGEIQPTGDEAQEYTDYFLYQFSILVSKDLSESTSDWQQNMPKVRQIMSFKEWQKNKELRPQHEFLDADAKLEREKYAPVEAQFMEWFEREGQIDRLWFRQETQWPAHFEESVRDRMQKVRENSTDIKDYKEKLKILANFVAQERKVIEVFANEWVKSEQMDYFSLKWDSMVPWLGQTIGEEVQAEIDVQFNKAWNMNTTPTQGVYHKYGKDLASELVDNKDLGKLLDFSTVVVAGYSLPIIDPFRLM